MNHFYLIPRRFKIININRIYKKMSKKWKMYELSQTTESTIK